MMTAIIKHPRLGLGGRYFRPTQAETDLVKSEIIDMLNAKARKGYDEFKEHIEGCGHVWHPDIQSYEATKILTDMRQLTLDEAIRNLYNVVFDYFPATFEEMLSSSRFREFVICRQVVIYFIKEIYKSRFSLKFIGKKMGGRDHSTVMHSIKTVEDLIDSDNEFRLIILRIRMDLNQMGL